MDHSVTRQILCNVPLSFVALIYLLLALLLGFFVYAGYRRYRIVSLGSADERRSLENRLGYWFPLTILVLVALTGEMLEGARIGSSPWRADKALATYRG